MLYILALEVEALEVGIFSSQFWEKPPQSLNFVCGFLGVLINIVEYVCYRQSPNLHLRNCYFEMRPFALSIQTLITIQAYF